MDPAEKEATDNIHSTSDPIQPSDMLSADSEQSKSNSSQVSPERTKDEPSTAGGARRGFRFWAIIASLCITGLLSALENTVVTTSLPTIVRDLNLGDNYIWVTNVFFLTRYARAFVSRHIPVVVTANCILINRARNR